MTNHLKLAYITSRNHQPHMLTKLNRLPHEKGKLRSHLWKHCMQPCLNLCHSWQVLFTSGRCHWPKSPPFFQVVGQVAGWLVVGNSNRREEWKKKTSLRLVQRVHSVAEPNALERPPEKTHAVLRKVRHLPRCLPLAKGPRYKETKGSTWKNFAIPVFKLWTSTSCTRGVSSVFGWVTTA